MSVVGCVVVFVFGVAKRPKHRCDANNLLFRLALRVLDIGESDGQLPLVRNNRLLNCIAHMRVATILTTIATRTIPEAAWLVSSHRDSR